MKEQFDKDSYIDACQRLQPSRKAVMEITQREEGRKKYSFRKRSGFVLASVMLSVFACSVIGIAAAGQIKTVFIDPDSGTAEERYGTLEETEDGYIVKFDKDEKSTKRDLTLEEQLGVSVVQHADTGEITLVTGDTQTDITEAMKAAGMYETTFEKEGKTWIATVTGGSEAPRVSVQEAGKEEK